MKRYIIFCLLFCMASASQAQDVMNPVRKVNDRWQTSCSEAGAEKSHDQAFYPGKRWNDNTGVHINAHGGGVLYHGGKYYWFGEHKGERSNSTHVGVTCYSSGTERQRLFGGKNGNSRQ